MVDTLTVDSRVALTKIISIFRLRDESSSGGLGGRLMCGIKTPQQECAKDAGRGGAYLRDTTVIFLAITSAQVHDYTLLNQH